MIAEEEVAIPHSANVLKKDLTEEKGMAILEREPKLLDGSSPTTRRPRLLDRLRQALRARLYNIQRAKARKET